MGSREECKCPHCGLTLPFTSRKNKDGSVVVHWPKVSYEHIRSHAEEAK